MTLNAKPLCFSFLNGATISLLNAKEPAEINRCLIQVLALIGSGQMGAARMTELITTAHLVGEISGELRSIGAVRAIMELIGNGYVAGVAGEGSSMPAPEEITTTTPDDDLDPFYSVCLWVHTETFLRDIAAYDAMYDCRWLQLDLDRSFVCMNAEWDLKAAMWWSIIAVDLQTDQWEDHIETPETTETREEWYIRLIRECTIQYSSGDTSGLLEIWDTACRRKERVVKLQRAQLFAIKRCLELAPGHTTSWAILEDVYYAIRESLSANELARHTAWREKMLMQPEMASYFVAPDPGRGLNKRVPEGRSELARGCGSCFGAPDCMNEARCHHCHPATSNSIYLTPTLSSPTGRRAVCHLRSERAVCQAPAISSGRVRLPSELSDLSPR